ncbi:MAG: cysteine desulfurase [Candidatus Hydrogenedentes bacterium]|nr:cysteine desulfurase [Candidatus Hydrogenedentota bacterium]
MDVARIREDFPILQLRRDGKPLVYLDNAATSQKPRQVIEALRNYYETQNANVHRAVHHLSQIATDAYEQARLKVKHFINSPLSCQVIFTRGATEGINLVAHSYGRQYVGPGDEVIVSAMEHHSNIVPWQMLCEEKGAALRVAPINDAGELIFEEFEKLLCRHTRLVAITHVSNALGTINPIRKIVEAAHRYCIPVLVDGAQSAPHLPINVQELDCDFFVCSGHKMFGPTGIGVLYGKAALLESMAPFLGGGDMILSVTFEKTTYNTLPYKFEAGTPHIEGVIGLGVAIDYLAEVGMDKIAAYEHELTEYGMQVLSDIGGVRMIGTSKEKAGVLSFTMDCAHPHDIGQVLDHEGIAIRAGHHCAQPVMQRFGVPATARASLAFYNTKEELDALGTALYRVKEVFE